MFTKIRSRMQGEGGFTLIELLVVIIIIAILAAIAIPTFLGQRNKANDAAAKSLVRNAMTAIESNYVDTRTFAGMVEADLKAIEPSINFTSGYTAPSGTSPSMTCTAATTNPNTVQYGGTADSYWVGCLSKSNKSFAVYVNKSTTNGGSMYFAGTAQTTW
jgi:type IV pilus assembly protein PilA